MCSPAGVVLQFGEDVDRVFGIPTQFNVPGPGGVFLGSVGDQAHATRTSSHNCAPMQESAVNGVIYHPDFAHAWDARPASKQIGEAMRAATLADPRVRYVLYDNVGTKPDGERWELDHPTFHVSFLPGTHDDLQPFFGEEDELSMADIAALIDAVETNTKAVKENTTATRNQHKKDRNQQVRLAEAEGRIEKAQADKIVAAIEAEDD